MSAGRLYGPKANGRVHKVRIAAKLSGVAIDFDESFEFGVSNKTDDYLSKFPLGQTPGFETNDGLILTESSAIALYLASLKENNPLLGSDKKELAKIHQYIFYVETQLVPHILSIALPAWGYAPYNETVEKTAYQGLDKSLSHLNSELDGKSFLVANKMTLADVIVGESLGLAYSMILDEPYRNKYPNVTKFFTSYRSKSEVKEIVGETALADKPLKVQSK